MARIFGNMMVFIFVALILSGCSRSIVSAFDNTMLEKVVKPWPLGLDREPPEGTPIFQAGWTDGCKSGLSSYGGSRYKAAYEFEQDPALVNNPEYYRAWKDSYTYCRWYVWNWDRPWQQ